jgi:uncharacterized protein
MDHANFDWDDAKIKHIAEHKVTPEEAEDVILGESMEMDFVVKNGEERWTYVGETVTARVLRVSFTIRAERIRVITAFDPSPLQIRIFIKWRAEQQ